MIVVLGSCVLDMIFTAPTLPILGQTVLADSLRKFPGGKGLNQAVAAARSGAEVAMIGCVGDDANGRLLREALHAEGIDTHALTETNHSTGVGVPVVVPSGDNGIIFHGGANDTMTTSTVDTAASTIAGADILLLQLEVPIEVTAAAASLAQSAGATVVLNAAPAESVPDHLLRATTILVANASEAKTMMSTDAAASAVELRGALGVETAIITKGDEGVEWASPDGSGSIAAFSVEAIDTVAAGDTFGGALAARLDGGFNLFDAISYAAAAAAVSVTRTGAASSAPTIAEVNQMLATQSPRLIHPG